MRDEDPKSLDIFGVKPFAEAINTATKGVVDGAGAFLGRICLPAAEEFGLLLKDRVSAWRGNNAINIVVKAEQKYKKYHISGEHAHPRIVYGVIENGSWVKNEMVQDMWAGLLASSCSQDGQDESNLIFMNILSQITTTQAIILNYACEHSKKYVSEGGWVGVQVNLNITLDELLKLTGISDFHRLDRELDHLRSLELMHAGFPHDSTTAMITPSGLGLQLYVRCQGYIGSPVEYFGLK